MGYRGMSGRRSFHPRVGHNLEVDIVVKVAHLGLSYRSTYTNPYVSKEAVDYFFTVQQSRNSPRAVIRKALFASDAMLWVIQTRAPGDLATDEHGEDVLGRANYYRSS
jgi:hypothetical protein